MRMESVGGASIKTNAYKEPYISRRYHILGRKRGSSPEVLASVLVTR